MSAFAAELVGTMMLILLGDGVVANTVYSKTKGNGGGWIVITTGWAFAVYAGVAFAAPYSGAHLNPAVTIGLAAAGRFAWANVGPYILAQLIGAMTGAVLVWIMYHDHLKATKDPGLRRAAFYTYPEIFNPVTNVISELLGTFALIFAVLYFVNPGIPEIGTADNMFGLGTLGALPVSIIVWVVGLSLGGTTGYAINPARDWGPRIVYNILEFKNRIRDDWKYSWVPVVGPILGCLLAAGLYLWLGK